MQVSRAPRLLTAALTALALVLAAGTTTAGTPRATARPGRTPGPRTRTSAARAPSIRPGIGVHPLRPGPYPPSSDRHTLGRLRPVTDLAAVPLSTVHFDAIPRIGPNWPADPIGAMGTDRFLTAANTSYALYDLAGAPVIPPVSLEPFFSYPARTQVFDPKVVYDPYGQHFVLVYLAVNDDRRRSWIQVVTIPDASADDPGTWCARRFKGDQVGGHGNLWADYPGLGYDDDRVVVTTNQFDFRRFRFHDAQILSFSKASLYDCAQRAAPDVVAGAETRNPDRSPAFTLQPAQSAGTPTTKQYLLSFERNRRASALVVWRLREGAAGLKLTRTAVPVSNVAISPFGTQRGGSVNKANTWWDPGDLRLINAFYDADLNRLYAAHTIFRDLKPDTRSTGYPEAVIRWYELEPLGRIRASTVTRKGIVGAPETDAGWPAVATDGARNLWITYSRASAPAGEYLSAWAAIVPPGTNHATSTLLASGSARFEATRGPERWGDFNGIARDPNDPTRVMMVNQYAKSDGVGPTRNWQETVDLRSAGVS